MPGVQKSALQTMMFGERFAQNVHHRIVSKNPPSVVISRMVGGGGESNA